MWGLMGCLMRRWMRRVRCRMRCLMDRISRGGWYRGDVASSLRRWRRAATRRIRLRRSRRRTCRLTALGISIAAARRGSAKWRRCRRGTVLRRTRTRAWLANIIGLWTRVLLRSRLGGLSRAGRWRWRIILRRDIIRVRLRGRRGVTSGLSGGICVLRWRLGRRLLIIWLRARTAVLSRLLLLTT